MSGEVNVTLVGTTGGPAELKFTQSGAAVVNFSLAVNPRRFDKQANEWRSQDTQWYRCTGWKELAESAGEVLTEKGMKVVVVGQLMPREFEKDGVKRLSLEVQVQDVAVSVRNGQARSSAGASAKAQSWGSGSAVSGGSDPWGEPPF